MPRPVDAYRRSVHYFPMRPTEAGWEVSALSRNNKRAEIMKSVSNQGTRHTTFQKEMLEKFIQVSSDSVIIQLQLSF